MAISGVYLGTFEGVDSLHIPVSGAENDVLAMFVQTSTRDNGNYWLQVSINGNTWPGTNAAGGGSVVKYVQQIVGGQPSAFDIQHPLQGAPLKVWLWRITPGGNGAYTAGLGDEIYETLSNAGGVWEMVGSSGFKPGGGAFAAAVAHLVHVASRPTDPESIYPNGIDPNTPSGWSRRDRLTYLYGLNSRYVVGGNCFDRITGPGVTIARQFVGAEPTDFFYFSCLSIVIVAGDGGADTVDGTLIADGTGGGGGGGGGGGAGGGVGTGGGESLMRSGGVSVGQCLATGGVGTGGGENLMRAGGVSPAASGCV